jgi:hypothetical protein
MPPRAKATKSKGAEVGKRYPLNMRTTFEVRRELEQAAAATGRSLAQEAEYRIQRTFQNQKVLQEALDLSFGPQISGLLMIIGDVMRATAQTASFAKNGNPSLENWSEDPAVFDEVAKEVAVVFAMHHPGGGLLLSSSKAGQEPEVEGIAIKRIRELASKNQQSSGKGRQK